MHSPPIEMTLAACLALLSGPPVRGDEPIPRASSIPAVPGGTLPVGAVLSMGTRRFRHEQAVLSVAIAPDGRTLATGDSGGAIRLWDIAGNRELRRLAGHRSPTPGHEPGIMGHEPKVVALAFDPGGKTLASAGWDGLIRIWDVASGDEVRQLGGHQRVIVCVAFSPDGKTLASSSQDQTIRIWEADTGHTLHLIRIPGLHPTRFPAWLAFSPDGKRLATLYESYKEDSILLLDVATGEPVRRFGGTHRSGDRLTFSPDGNVLAAVEKLAAIQLWDVATGREIRTFSGTRAPIFSGSRAPVDAIAFAPDGKTLASGGGIHLHLANDLIKATELILWDVGSGQQIRRFVGQEGMITGVAFSPDGKTLASGSDDASIMLWDAATGAELRQFTGHGNEVFAVAFSPDGRVVASGSQDRTVRLWDATSGRELRRLETQGPVRSLAFRPDGRVLATGGGVNQPDRSGTRNFAEVRLWDVDTGRELRQLAGHRAGVGYVAFSPDGEVLATASPDITERDAALRLWDAATGRELRRFGSDIQGFRCEGLAFSPDGTALAASIPGSIVLWSLDSGAIRRRLSLGGGISAFAFRPDGKTLAAKHGDREVALQFWDLASGRSSRDLALPQWSGLNSVAFSPDGAVAAAYASTIQLWEADAGREVGRFEGRPGRIHSIAFSPDGKRLASGHADASVMIWDVGGLPGLRRPRP